MISQVSALVLLKHFVALVYSQKYHQLFSPVVIFISALLYLNFYFVDVPPATLKKGKRKRMDGCFNVFSRPKTVLNVTMLLIVHP